MVVEIYCEWDKAYVVTVSPVVKFCDFYLTSIAQLSQRDRVAGWVSFGQKWKTGTGRHFADIVRLSSSTVT